MHVLKWGKTCGRRGGPFLGSGQSRPGPASLLPTSCRCFIPLATAQGDPPVPVPHPPPLSLSLSLRLRQPHLSTAWVHFLQTPTDIHVGHFCAQGSSCLWLSHGTCPLDYSLSGAPGGRNYEAMCPLFQQRSGPRAIRSSSVTGIM